MLYYSLLDFSSLSDAETDAVRQRIKKHFSDGKSLKRKESVAVRALLCHMLCSCFGVTDFSVECDGNGKPYITGSNLHFNLSHSGKYALCVCGTEKVGCDIEQIKKFNERVVERFFCEKECIVLKQSNDVSAVFTKLWTLKESALKFTGAGIAGGLDSYDFSAYCNDDKILMNNLVFNTFEVDGFSVSICSEKGNAVQLEADINDII